MEILKEGNMPRPKEYQGKCSTCGCVIQVTEHEIEWEEDRGRDYATCKCPTSGCDRKIYVEEIEHKYLLTRCPECKAEFARPRMVCSECGFNLKG